MRRCVRCRNGHGCCLQCAGRCAVADLQNVINAANDDDDDLDENYDNDDDFDDDYDNDDDLDDNYDNDNNMLYWTRRLQRRLGVAVHYRTMTQAVDADEQQQQQRQQAAPPTDRPPHDNDNNNDNNDSNSAVRLRVNMHVRIDDANDPDSGGELYFTLHDMRPENTLLAYTHTYVFIINRNVCSYMYMAYLTFVQLLYQKQTMQYNVSTNCAMLKQ